MTRRTSPTFRTSDQRGTTMTIRTRTALTSAAMGALAAFAFGAHGSADPLALPAAAPVADRPPFTYVTACGDDGPDGGTLEVYEDGAGVCYDSEGTEQGTHPVGTFSWNCMTQGNKDCGPGWELWENHLPATPSDVEGSVDCMALVGPTTLLHCRNGAITTS